MRILAPWTIPFGIPFGAGFLVSVFIIIGSNFEIHTLNYKWISKQIKEHPNLQPLVDTLMSDGMISEKELSRIKRLRKSILKESLIMGTNNGNI